MVKEEMTLQEEKQRIFEGIASVSSIPYRMAGTKESFPVWEEMRRKADSMEVPLLFTKDLKIFWVVIRDGEIYHVSGPVSIRPLTAGQLKRYYMDYGLAPASHQASTTAENAGQENNRPFYTNPHVVPFQTILNLTVTQTAVLGRNCRSEEIMKANHLPDILLEDNTRREQILFEMAAEQEEIAHHSYEEERYLLQCVREGRTDEALRQNAAMDPQLGRMSKKETDQWRKTVTVAITLCSRAAIEGGISPSQAYQISDYYLQKSDGCQTPEALINCRNQAVIELSNLVHTRNTQRHTSNYVEQCKDYVRKNYKSKIYVADIASALGISETYLSRLFSKETGQRLQDYISQVRVDKAANLLMYSEESIADIAEYCCFPSQSYFGHVFLKFKGMSPNRFREKYKPAEFTER